MGGGKKGGEAPGAPPGGKSGKGRRERTGYPGQSKRKGLDDTLSADDDESVIISKKISWILRHGTRRVGLEMDDQGWVKLQDLMELEVMAGITEESILVLIHESNKEKRRYELRDADDGKRIRALNKVERKAGLRHDAPAFAPYPAMPPAATYGALPNPMAYPWPFGFMPMMPGMPGFPPESFPAAPPGAAAAAGRYPGRIKSYNADKGFGFIESEMTHAHFHRDVFVHKAVIGSFKVGDAVMFGVQTNEQGMPQARDLVGMPGFPVANAGPGKGGRGKGGQGKGGQGKGGRGKAKEGKGAAGKSAEGGGAEKEKTDVAEGGGAEKEKTDDGGGGGEKADSDTKEGEKSTDKVESVI